jgi:hypothetical protein
MIMAMVLPSSYNKNRGGICWYLDNFQTVSSQQKINKTITRKLLNFLKRTGWQVCLLQKHLYWLGYRSVTFWQAGHDTYYRNTYID